MKVEQHRNVQCSEAVAYLRLIDSFITQLKYQGPPGTCNECQKEEEEEKFELRRCGIQRISMNPLPRTSYDTMVGYPCTDTAVPALNYAPRPFCRRFYFRILRRRFYLPRDRVVEFESRSCGNLCRFRVEDNPDQVAILMAALVLTLATTPEC